MISRNIRQTDWPFGVGFGDHFADIAVDFRLEIQVEQRFVVGDRTAVVQFVINSQISMRRLAFPITRRD